MSIAKNDVLRFLRNTFEMGSARPEITSNGVININGSIAWQGKHNLLVKFGTINGNFTITDRKIKTLKGLPTKITNILNMSRCGLTTLSGCTPEVGEFRCEENEIIDLVGGPTVVAGHYRISKNRNLTSLQGCIPVVNGWFSASRCALTDLNGGPHTVQGDYNVSENPLKSLAGLPTTVGENLWIPWIEDLPMLKLLTVSYKRLMITKNLNEIPDISNIITEHREVYHAGPNKALMSCQRALIKAGYGGNAKW